MTTSTKTDLLRKVVEVDPDFYAEKAKQDEYEFSNDRKFTGNPAKRGAYSAS